MDLGDFEYNGGHAYVVGLFFCFPPRYAYFDSYSSDWSWTGELTKAETFMTEKIALSHMENDMSALVDGNKDVKVLKVEMKVGPA